MIALKIDEEVLGRRKDFDSVEKVLEELKEIMDERVYEVTVKKRAAVNSSRECNVGCSE